MLDQITSIAGVKVNSDGSPVDQYEQIDHPRHYGGAGDPYEAIKVIEAWGLGFCLGNAVKYLARAGRKPGTDAVTDLRKAAWYIQREIDRLERIGKGNRV